MSLAQPLKEDASIKSEMTQKDEYG